jgi:hypothetical protein
MAEAQIRSSKEAPKQGKDNNNNLHQEVARTKAKTPVDNLTLQMADHPNRVSHTYQGN